MLIAGALLMLGSPARADEPRPAVSANVPQPSHSDASDSNGGSLPPVVRMVIPHNPEPALQTQPQLPAAVPASR